MQIIIDGLLTDYNKHGTGPTVLLLHGWADSKETFSDLSKHLVKKHTVITVDLPGFGKSQAPVVAWGLEDYAQFISVFLKKIGHSDVSVLIAHSNGAAVAIKGVAKGFLQPHKMILLGAAGVRNHQKAQKLALKIIAKSGKVLTIWLPNRRRKQLQKLLYGTAGSDMLVAPHLKETFKRTVREDIQLDARQIRIPTLLIYGEQDQATPPSLGRIMHQNLPNSTLEIIGDAGHFVHHDQLSRLQKLMDDF